MKIKKCFSVIFAILLGVSFVGCSTGNAQRNTIDLPEFLSSMKAETPYKFVAYMSPPPENSGSGEYSTNPNYMTDEHYKNMADCGFNYATGLYENSKSQYLRGIELAQKFNMKYYVRDYSFVDGCIEGIINGASNKEEAESLLAEYQTSIKNRFDEYSQYSSFAGVLATDEPSSKRFESIAVMNKWYQENYPNTEFQVNLLPTYANQSQLFGSNASEEEYKTDYVIGFDELVNPSVLSYDHYALSKSGTSYKISSSYLKNLEIFAEQSQKSNKDFYVFILTLGHWDYRIVEEYRDIAWQVYTAMAYGARGVQTFTYWTNLVNSEEANIKTALVDKDGTLLPAYYAMKEVISEVRAMEDVYLNFSWQGTMPVLADKYETNMNFDMLDNPLDSIEGINKVTTSEDIIVGSFKDEDNNKGYMFSNMSDPYYNKTANVKVELSSAKHLVVYKKGRTLIYPVNNGIVEFKLGSGEGCFAVPID